MEKEWYLVKCKVLYHLGRAALASNPVLRGPRQEDQKFYVSMGYDFFRPFVKNKTMWGWGRG